MGNKDLARTRAIARWPAHADLFARKCDVDRAEAVLIALADLRREAHHHERLIRPALDRAVCALLVHHGRAEIKL
jgi:hypothetical protein